MDRGQRGRHGGWCWRRAPPAAIPSAVNLRASGGTVMREGAGMHRDGAAQMLFTPPQRDQIRPRTDALHTPGWLKRLTDVTESH